MIKLFLRVQLCFPLPLLLAPFSTAPAFRFNVRLPAPLAGKTSIFKSSMRKTYKMPEISNRYVTFDVETTGFSPRRGSRIIEIGAVLMEGGKMISEDVFPRFHSYISGCTLVAHNAAFDISFLRHEFSRLGLGITNGYFCTMQIERKIRWKQI
jgi:DNA polymerase III epsilon subunit-like protein